ncbi:hypothetical protein QFZ54_001562 [Sphingomonas faeni]|nr:hypothetical protein [Sphingomonas faeni]
MPQHPVVTIYHLDLLRLEQAEWWCIGAMSPKQTFRPS